MFEFHQCDSGSHTSITPESDGNRLAPIIEQASLLYWSEHCIECAAPSCFTTCDLYQRRPDGRCRRFTSGMLKNGNFSSLRGYGVEVEFKKWGKLEARANLVVQPIRTLIWKERILEFCFPVVNFVGLALQKITGDERWSQLSYALASRIAKRLFRSGQSASQPDAFLLEVYNPSKNAVKIQLRMTPAIEGEGDGLVNIQKRANAFATTISLEPGYSSHQFDRKLFQAVIDTGMLFDVSIIPEADTTTKLVITVADFVAFDKGAGKEEQSQLPAIKCVVWDLDNTLWEGILIEDSNVRLRREVIEIIRRLDLKGILMSVVSKNDHDIAMAKLNELGISEFFLCPQISWLPKSQGIKAIAKSLNIGLDTFAFVDDNPFELAEVAAALPMVAGIPVDQMGSAVADPRFSGSDSPDARNRRQYYREAFQREEVQAAYGDDYFGFLAQSKISLTIKRYEDADFDRVSELVQRTNQLNFSGKKYGRQEVARLVADQRLDKYVLACSDKFGSYGTVGFSIVHESPEEIVVQDFMLSCRVQGKYIEKAFFGHLVARAVHADIVRFRVNYVPTNRNTPAKQVLEQLGFRKMDSFDGLVLDDLDKIRRCEFIRVET